MNQNLNTDANNKGSFILLIIFSVLAFFCVLINGRVFDIVYIKSKRKSRPANILVAHLAVIVTGFTCLVFIHFLNKSNVISLGSHGLCNFIPLAAQGIHNVFSLNIGAIIWVRTRSDAANLGKSLAYRAISIMWTIVFVAYLPYLFMAEYTQRPGTKLNQCKKINILGSFAVTISYEGLKVLLFNVMVCVYIIRVTCKIRSSLKYLQSQLFRSEKTMKKIQHVRHVQWHSFIIISYFPHGVGSFLYKLFGHLGWRSSYDVAYTIPLVIYIYMVFILCPLSYVYLLEDISIVKFFTPCWQKNEAPNFLINVGNQKENDFEEFGWKMELPLKQKSRMEKSVFWSKETGVRIQESYDHVACREISLLTTVESTKTSAVAAMALPAMVSIENCVTRSSTPESLTPSTSYILTTITAQVHPVPEDRNVESETGLGKRNSETLI